MGYFDRIFITACVIRFLKYGYCVMLFRIR